jgi:putative MFS transporter
LGLALIVGSSNVITPQASVAALVPAYSYLAAWFALAGFVYVFFATETKSRSLETIEHMLDDGAKRRTLRVKTSTIR